MKTAFSLQLSGKVNPPATKPDVFFASGFRNGKPARYFVAYWGRWCFNASWPLREIWASW